MARFVAGGRHERGPAPPGPDRAPRTLTGPTNTSDGRRRPETRSSDLAGTASLALVQRYPVLWLCGPSGVGKTSVGYEMFDQLSNAGTATAYVDLDQLGLCYPAPGDDPSNHRVKARNLAEVWSGFRAAGAQCLVVSGIVDDADEVRRHADLIPDTALTVCRLRVSHDELRSRIARRGSLLHLTEEAVRSATELDRTDFADQVVDTAELTVPQVATRVRAAGWPGRVPPREMSALPSSNAAHTSTVPVLWLCGPPAVGKSTVGFEIFMHVLGDGVPAAYIDLAQIGFCRPAPDDDPDHHRLKAHHLGRVWEGFRAAGAQCLIISGNVTDHRAVGRYTDAIPSAAWTLCRLRARPDTLAERILLRGQGGGPAIAGDELRGLPEAQLRRRAAQATQIADALEHASIGNLRVDTDTREIAELADLVRTEAGSWPSRALSTPQTPDLHPVRDTPRPIEGAR
jgi:adenylylsulfate kinase-like enzyme